MADTTAFFAAHPPQEQLYRLLHDLYVLLDASDREALSPVGMTTSQFTVLSLLDAEAGQKLTILADRLLVARSTITHLIDQMEKAGWVARIADPDDRRAQRVTLTATGAAVREQAQAVHRSSLEARINLLDPDEQQTLLTLLGKLRVALDSPLAQEVNPDLST